MGGNLIRDILEADMEKVNSLESLILVPAQNPEVLREYLYENNYEIINKRGEKYERYSRFKKGYR